MHSKSMSNYLFMLSGILEAVKIIGIMWVYEFFWTNDFYRLSFNVDLISAFGALLSPWLIAYLQKSRESEREAYIIVVTYLLPLTLVIAFVYCLLARYLFIELKNYPDDFEAFVAARAASIVAMTFSALNFSVLAQLGKGACVFLFQLCSVLVTLSLYYIFSDYGLFSSLMSVGISLLAFELVVVWLTFNVVKKNLSIASFAKEIRGINHSEQLRIYGRIVLPETGTVLSVVASTFLLSCAAYLLLGETYEVYRLPLAFMTASWIVACKVTTLLLSFGKDSTLIFSLYNFKYTLKYTWYIPVVMLFVYLVLFFDNISSTVLINIALVVCYFPFMALVIAVSGALRVHKRNDLLLKANLAMLCLYFIPVVILVYFGLIDAGNLIHVIGVSYLVRVLMIKIISAHKIESVGSVA